MNHIRRSCRSLVGLPRRAGLLIASAAPAVLWADPPLPPSWNKHLPLPAGPRPAARLPPGWDKHPPLPAHGHPLATGGTPGWQLTLMAVTAILLAAASVAITNPGPRRAGAGKRRHGPTDDRISHHASPQRQPGERPHPASQQGRDGSAGRYAQDIAAAASVATGHNWPAPSATTPRWRTMIAPRLRPRTVQLCIHCRQNPAGFWVSRTSDQTARRPWCLSCCQWLDPRRYHLIPFDRDDPRRCR